MMLRPSLFGLCKLYCHSSEETANNRVGALPLSTGKTDEHVQSTAVGWLHSEKVVRFSCSANTRYKLISA